MNIIIPPKLNKGDKIGIVSPSNSVKSKLDIFKIAKKNFAEAFDVEIVVAKHALGRHYYTSGTTEERLLDIHDMFQNPEIKAVLFSVGGANAIDLVDILDYDLIKKNPKIFSGISDATTLLNAVFAKTGLVTFLGIEFLDFGRESMNYTKEEIKKTWFKDNISEYQPNPDWRDFDGRTNNYQGWRTIKDGVAEGRIVGGNLRSFFQLINTEYFLDREENILAIETYKFPKKAIHRGLKQLKIHGVFDKISGLIVGYLVGSDDSDIDGNERDIKDLVLEATEGYDFPIMQVGEIGHRVENLILSIGAQAKIDATNLKFSVNEQVVN